MFPSTASKPLTRCSRLPDLDYVNPVLMPVMGPWIDLPSSIVSGDEVRYRIVADLYVRAFREGSDKRPDALAQDLLVVQVERRNAGLLDIYSSTYKSQILIGGLVDGEHAADLFSETSLSLQGLWCAGCFTDDIYGSGRGAVEIPHWMKGRYFSEMSNLPTCGTCGCQPQVFRTDTLKAADHAHLFSSICHTDLQTWVEAELAPHGIAPANLAWMPGPASSPTFQEELVAAAFCPERAAQIVELGGKEALREMMGCSA